MAQATGLGNPQKHGIWKTRKLIWDFPAEKIACTFCTAGPGPRKATCYITYLLLVLSVLVLRCDFELAHEVRVHAANVQAVHAVLLAQGKVSAVGNFLVVKEPGKKGRTNEWTVVCLTPKSPTSRGRCLARTFFF